MTARPKTKLLGEEQREHAETFSEGHADDGLHEDLGRGAGIAANGFSGLGADHTDADGGAEKTESGGDVAVDFSEDGGHVVDVFLVAVAAVRTLWHAPDGKVKINDVIRRGRPRDRGHRRDCRSGRCKRS